MRHEGSKNFLISILVISSLSYPYTFFYLTDLIHVTIPLIDCHLVDHNLGLAEYV